MLFICASSFKTADRHLSNFIAPVVLLSCVKYIYVFITSRLQLLSFQPMTFFQFEVLTVTHKQVEDRVG